MLFYIGLSLFIIGLLFKIKHWSYPSALLVTAILIVSAYLLTVLLEINFSVKATIATKLVWTIITVVSPVLAYFYLQPMYYLLVLYISGKSYFATARKLFVKGSEQQA